LGNEPDSEEAAVTDELRDRIRQQFGPGIPEKVYRDVEVPIAGARRTAVDTRPAELTQPLTLRIPWSCLISDNDKHVVEKGTGRRFTTPEYKNAQARIRLLAGDALEGRPAASGPMAFVARVWMPDRRRHDVLNFGKCTIDSLTGLVFVDDSQLHDVRWIRAGVDVDQPRAELTISPLPPAVTGRSA
jgi:Holliday junction resolvase RusA-like endonuclease